MPRWAKPVGVVLAFALVVVLAGGWWLKRQIDPSGAPGDQVEIVIAEGTSTNGVAELLAAENVVVNETVFKLYLKAKGAGPFQAGTYRLRTRSAMGDVVDALEDGPALPPAVNITVPEGLVLEQIANRVHEANERLSAARFLEVARSGEIRSRF
jgi:UPF0755 protein